MKMAIFGNFVGKGICVDWWPCGKNNRAVYTGYKMHILLSKIRPYPKQRPRSQTFEFSFSFILHELGMFNSISYFTSFRILCKPSFWNLSMNKNMNVWHAKHMYDYFDSTALLISFFWRVFIWIPHHDCKSSYMAKEFFTGSGSFALVREGRR